MAPTNQLHTDLSQSFYFKGSTSTKQSHTYLINFNSILVFSSRLLFPPSKFYFPSSSTILFPPSFSKNLFPSSSSSSSTHMSFNLSYNGAITRNGKRSCTPSVPSVPPLYISCTLSVPLLYPSCTLPVPLLYPSCTLAVPLLYPLAVPLLYPCTPCTPVPSCTLAVPLFYTSCTTVHLLHPYCTTLLYTSCTLPVPLLYPLCTLPVPFLYPSCTPIVPFL